MAIENPIYDTSVGGTRIKSRAAANVEYGVFKALKMFFRFLGMMATIGVQIVRDIGKQISGR